MTASTLGRRQLAAGLLLSASLAAMTVAPALAQTERLPAQSRAERQINDINRSIARQQRIQRESQQTQFEINQLRREIQRDTMFPSVTGPGVQPGCPRGSIGC